MSDPAVTVSAVRPAFSPAISKTVSRQVTVTGNLGSLSPDSCSFVIGYSAANPPATYADLAHDLDLSLGDFDSVQLTKLASDNQRFRCQIAYQGDPTETHPAWVCLFAAAPADPTDAVVAAAGPIALDA